MHEQCHVCSSEFFFFSYFPWLGLWEVCWAVATADKSMSTDSLIELASWKISENLLNNFTNYPKQLPDSEMRNFSSSILLYDEFILKFRCILCGRVKGSPRSLRSWVWYSAGSFIDFNFSGNRTPHLIRRGAVYGWKCETKYLFNKFLTNR